MTLQALILVAASCGLPMELPKEGALRDRLLTLEKRALDAVKQRDLDTLKRLTADDYESILFPEGRENKEQMLQNVADCAITGYALTDVRAVSLGRDAGVLTYTVVYKGTFKGKPIPEDPLYASAVWVCRGGQWMCVLYQETPKPRE